jgi:RimJ/RimL family protein N-acetyltransferase
VGRALTRVTGINRFRGLWYFRSPPSLELLFGVAPHHWNRGIATEAGSSVIRYAFGVLGFDAREASTDFANSTSIRVLEKLSMRVQRRATVDGLDTVFYALTRDEWLKNQY